VRLAFTVNSDYIISITASLGAEAPANPDGGSMMRKPRPNSYNPVQALHLIANDRNGTPLSCPSCSGSIERDPLETPPPPRTHVTLSCSGCGRTARYIAGAA
jgi:hypothetical protein